MRVKINNRAFQEYKNADGSYDYDSLIGRAKKIVYFYDQLPVKEKMALSKKKATLLGFDYKKISRCVNTNCNIVRQNKKGLEQATLNLVFLFDLIGGNSP